MPVYTSVEDVRGLLTRDPEVTRGTAASLADAELTAQIDSAEAEINAVISSRYVVPFEAPAPALVKSITEDIAAYLATLTYRQGRDLEANDPIVLRYNRARLILTAIGNGKADLEVPAEGGHGGTIGAPINRHSGRLFCASDFGLGRGGCDDGWG